MKKTISTLLALMLLLGIAALVPARAENETPLIIAGPDAEMAPAAPVYSDESFAVGTFTPLTGNFFTGMWGNGTADNDVKELLHGYPLAKFDMAAGNYLINTDAVSGYQMTVVAYANRRYNIFLTEDMRWSDGTPVTAYDYAFSILMQMHPETANAGADRPDLSYILGGEDYMNGRTDVLEGLRILGDYQLQITVKKKAFPYYYELSYIDFKPYPAKVIAPGVTVKDDGKGAYLKGKYTASVLKKTVLGENGYLTAPSVVCGPYTLVSYADGTAVLKRNEYYKPNAEGRLPYFKELVYKPVTHENAAEALKNGEIGLLHKTSDAAAIAAGAELMKDGAFVPYAYPRTGLSFISFCLERPGVSDAVVRKAIAMCLDKDALTKACVGTSGTAVNGYYGIGQWMYQIVSSTDYPTEDGIELFKWQKLSMDNLPVYGYDPAAAGEMLENAGYVLNRQTGARELRAENGRITKLDFTLYVGAGSNAEAFLRNEFAAALAEAGVKLTVKALPFDELLKYYYRQKIRKNDMFFLASNFSAAFNPAGELDPAESAQGVRNRTGVRDEALYEAAFDMAHTEPGDRLGYCTKWMKFLSLMQETLPVIPVYSDMYFDYAPEALENYTISAYTTWAEALLNAGIAD